MWEMQNSPLGSAGRERRRFHQKLPIPNEALLEIRAHAININAIFFPRAKRALITGQIFNYRLFCLKIEVATFNTSIFGNLLKYFKNITLKTPSARFARFFFKIV